MLTKNEVMLLVDEAEALAQELEEAQDRESISRQLFDALESLQDVGSPLLQERLPNLQAWTEALAGHDTEDEDGEGAAQSLILEQLAEIRLDLDLLDWPDSNGGDG